MLPSVLASLSCAQSKAAIVLNHGSLAIQAAARHGLVSAALLVLEERSWHRVYCLQPTSGTLQE